MFNSTVFSKTRNIDRGVPSSYYLKKNTETYVGDDIDNNLNNYRRDTLKNYRPDPVMLDQDQPRENVGSTEKLNLRHYGAIRPELPYTDSSYDIQFRDHDPRGYLEEQNWRKYRNDAAPRMNLQNFGKDEDFSITERGITPTDMMGRITELRRALRGRIQWFSESLDNFVVRNYNTDSYINQKNHVIEDTSSTVDPTILDSVGRMNINRIMSNNLHTGGSYFINSTTPDQVLPVAQYGFVFKSGAPLTINQTTDMMTGSQRITTLDVNEKNKLLKVLLNVNNHPNVTTEQNRFDKLLSRQNNPRNNIVVKDIMAILGITENELKYVQSMENTNKQVYEQCMANLLDMVVVLEKLPPNVLLDIRGELLSMRTPEFHGGTCKNTVYNQHIKNILESGVNKQNIKYFGGGDNSTNSNRDQNFNITSSVKKNEYFAPQQGETKLEPVNYMQEINKAKRINAQNNPNQYLGKTDQLINTSMETIKKISSVFNYRKPESSTDISFGKEHTRDDDFKPLNTRFSNLKLDFL